MIRVGWDRQIKKFSYIAFWTDEKVDNIEYGVVTDFTKITPILVPYELIGIYSTTLYNPYKGEGVIETL